MLSPYSYSKLFKKIIVFMTHKSWKYYIYRVGMKDTNMGIRRQKLAEC